MAAIRAALAFFFRSSAMGFLNPSIIGLYLRRTMARVRLTVLYEVAQPVEIPGQRIERLQSSLHNITLAYSAKAKPTYVLTPVR